MISFAFGLRLFNPSNGLHKTALVMKIADLDKPMCLSKISKLSPDLSPWKGTPVLPAPNLPGASATKTILDFRDPLAELKIACWSAREGQMRHVEAFSSSFLKPNVLLFNILIWKENYGLVLPSSVVSLSSSF